MNDELRQLAALDALGALSPGDAALLADALASDVELARELELDRAVVERLGGALAREAPPLDLGDRIATAAQADVQGQPAAAGRAAPRPRWRLWLPAIGGVAAAAAIVLAIVVTGDSGLGPPDQQVDIVAAEPAAPVRGRAALYHPERPDGHLVVDLESLRPAPPGHHYEVWVLRKGVTTMEKVGSFSSADASVHLELDLPGSGDYAALDISVEEDEGPPEHSGKSVAGAKFETS
jgi:anti-sigma-K factor RskA